jgi:hypothetical protein
MSAPPVCLHDMHRNSFTFYCHYSYNSLLYGDITRLIVLTLGLLPVLSMWLYWVEKYWWFTSSGKSLGKYSQRSATNQKTESSATLLWQPISGTGIVLPNVVTEIVPSIFICLRHSTVYSSSGVHNNSLVCEFNYLLVWGGNPASGTLGTVIWGYVLSRKWNLSFIMSLN